MNLSQFQTRDRGVLPHAFAHICTGGSSKTHVDLQSYIAHAESEWREKEDEVITHLDRY